MFLRARHVEAHMARGNELMGEVLEGFVRMDEGAAERDREMKEFFAELNSAAAERERERKEFFAGLNSAAAERERERKEFFAELSSAAAERERESKEFFAELSSAAAEREGVLEEQLRLTREEIQITREVVRRNEIAFRDSRRVMSELVDEVRAQTQAIFALIDEIRGGGASPQAA